MNTDKSFITKLGELIDQHRVQLQQTTAQHSRIRSGRFESLIRWLMPNGGTLLLIAILILTQSVWAVPLQSTVNAPGPSAATVNYQGRLANSGGTPLSGTFGMTFAIYDASTAGNLIWGPESHAAVSVSSGLFNVGLGSQTAGGIPTSVWNGDRYLEITVGGETLTPRELIRSVPIAGMALTVSDGAITNAKIANGAVTRAKAPLLVASTIQNVEMQYGRVIAQATGTTGLLTVDIDFVPDFSTQPRVFLQPIYNYTPAVIATPGGPCDGATCRIYLVRTDGASWQAGHIQGVEWMAMGQR